MRHLATLAFGAAVTIGGTLSATAQTVPEGQSCGGLLCDMGIFGHKTAPPSGNDAPAPVTPAAAAPSTPVAVAPTEPAKARATHKKRIAKTARPPKPEAPKREVAKHEPTTHAPPKPAPAAVTTPAAAVPAARTATPTAQGTNILDPFAKPLPPNYTFQPIYR